MQNDRRRSRLPPGRLGPMKKKQKNIPEEAYFVVGLRVGNN
jgi:hypothetical protein